MDVLIFLAIMLLLLALVGGYISMQHAIIKPIVDWMQPAIPAPATPSDRSPASGRGLLDMALLLVLALGLVGGMLMAVMWMVGWL